MYALVNARYLRGRWLLAGHQLTDLTVVALDAVAEVVRVELPPADTIRDDQAAAEAPDDRYERALAAGATFMDV